MTGTRIEAIAKIGWATNFSEMRDPNKQQEEEKGKKKQATWKEELGKVNVFSF